MTSNGLFCQIHLDMLSLIVILLTVVDFQFPNYRDMSTSGSVQTEEPTAGCPKKRRNRKHNRNKQSSNNVNDDCINEVFVSRQKFHGESLILTC